MHNYYFKEYQKLCSKLKDMVSATAQNRIRIVALVLLFMTGINALAAGYSFMVDPSGKGLGMTTDYLKYSPFNDFLLPGIILFTANGILSTAIAVISLKKIRFYPSLISFQGCILSGWIMIQLVLILFFHPLHLITGIIGIALIVMGTLLEKYTE
jgi:hypothetical protein